MTSHDDLSDVLADLARHAPAATDVLDSDRLRTRIHRRRRRRQLTVAGGSIAAAAAIGTATTFALRPDAPNREPIATQTPSPQQAFEWLACGRPVTTRGIPVEGPLEWKVEIEPVVHHDGGLAAKVGQVTITNVSNTTVSGITGTGPDAALSLDGLTAAEALPQPAIANAVELQPGQSVTYDAYASLRACNPYGQAEPVVPPDAPLPPGRYEVYVSWGVSTEASAYTTPDIKLYSGPIPVEIR